MEEADRKNNLIPQNDCINLKCAGIYLKGNIGELKHLIIDKLLNDLFNIKKRKYENV